MDNSNKPNELGEDDLVDYEEEDDTPVEKPAENGKHSANKGTYVGIHSAGFKDFLLGPELLRAIQDCGFEHPSEVQHECIPQAVLGYDILCQAKSGMGKTAVFVLAVLQQLVPAEGEVSAIVLGHTRELAYQIAHEIERFSKYLPAIRSAVIYGGVPVKQHKDLLASNPPHIVVGTPGRVKDLVQQKALDLSKVKFFVLDECDKVLDALDMRRDIQQIFTETPHVKQVMMFTATLSKEMRTVAKKFMKDPIEVIVDDETKLTLHGLLQYYVKLTEAEKNRKMADILDALEFNQVVIFVKSVSRAIELNKLLVECNFPSIDIHSNIKQDERIRRYKAFKDFQKRILVATDIFGRGIDIERVNIVINYDMSSSPDSYLHRVGRAGRFGTKGLAISFISSETDSDVLQGVQSRFEVAISELPQTVDQASYMNA
ncbi:unnamed protein product [Agarophyton chilense]